MALLVITLHQARADEAPWRSGVSAERQQAAQKLLDAGNAFIVDNKYGEALEQFKQAVAIWEHPAIRFNMVRCLVQLERWLEASDSLELALKYGAAPFDQNIYQEALAFQKLLANQIGELEVTCAQPGVQVALDGKALLACPGSKKERVLPGQHQVVGTNQGFVPKNQQVVVLGGKHERVDVALVSLAKAARVTHRWSWWVPWAVIGGAAVVAGVGELVDLKAAVDNDAYKASVTMYCGMRCASDDPRLDHAAENRARIENGIAIGVFSLAGAVLATGGTMVYLNRGRTVYDAEAPHVGVAPLSGGAAVIATGRF